MEDQEATNIHDSRNIHEAPEVPNSHKTCNIHEALDMYEFLNQPPSGDSQASPSVLPNETQAALRVTAELQLGARPSGPRISPLEPVHRVDPTTFQLPRPFFHLNAAPCPPSVLREDRCSRQAGGTQELCLSQGSGSAVLVPCLYLILRAPATPPHTPPALHCVFSISTLNHAIRAS